VFDDVAALRRRVVVFAIAAVDGRLVSSVVDGQPFPALRCLV